MCGVLHDAGGFAVGAGVTGVRDGGEIFSAVLTIRCRVLRSDRLQLQNHGR